MQGLWKDKRKHFLRDKKNFLKKHYGEEFPEGNNGKPYKVENDFVIVGTYSEIKTNFHLKLSDYIDIFKVNIFGKIYFAFEFDRKWYNYDDFKKIKVPDSSESKGETVFKVIEVYSTVHISSIPFIFDIVEKRKAKLNQVIEYKPLYSFERKLFSYNKLFPYYSFNWHYSGAKEAQKMVHRQERALLRSWIRKGDWDSEVPVSQYSKSLSYYLY